jgi:hypothetical protein
MTTTLRGTALLHDPQLNKSTAFTESEREALGLVGLVPEGIDNEDTQIQRVLLQLGKKPTDLEKYIYLSQLQDTDERLFLPATHVGSRTLPAARIHADGRRGLPAVWPHYPPSQGSICFNQAERARTKYSPQLAGTRCAFHCGYQRSANSWARRPRRQRHGHPDRKVGALYRMRRHTTAVLTSHPCRLWHQQ